MMIRPLTPWLVPLVWSSVLHAGLVWAALDMTFTWVPRPLAEFPVYLTSVDEPPPTVARPEQKPREPRRIITRSPVRPAPPTMTLPPPRPVESTANTEPPPVTIEERRPIATEQNPRMEMTETTAPRIEQAPPLAIHTVSPSPAVDAPAAPAPQTDTPAREATSAPASPAPPRGGSSTPTIASLPKSGTNGTGTTTARPRGGYQVVPAYPATARRLGIEGTTMLRVHVSAEGRVEDIEIQKSAGHPDLDRAAAEAVRRWRFEPARKGQDAVAVWVLLPVEFHLTP